MPGVILKYLSLNLGVIPEISINLGWSPGTKPKDLRGHFSNNPTLPPEPKGDSLDECTEA